MSTAAEKLQQLRQQRGRRERDVSIVGDIERTASEATRVHRKMGEFIELWQSLVPAAIAGQTTIVSLRGGIVHVQVDSSAAGFELDRLLRGGLLVQLRSRFLRHAFTRQGESRRLRRSIIVNPQTPRPKSDWPMWALLVVFIFLAFECALLAVALKGSWFILLAPGIVCAVKALDIGRELRKRLESGQS